MKNNKLMSLCGSYFVFSTVWSIREDIIATIVETVVQEV